MLSRGLSGAPNLDPIMSGGENLTHADEIFSVSSHTEKSFRNLVRLNQNQIVFTISRLILNQMDVRLVQNQSKNG